MGRYRVVAELGRGGMSVVYQAVDPEGALWALKVCSGCPQRPEWEWMVASQLDSPYLLRCLEYEPGLFLRYPLLHGETLQERLTRVGRLPVSEIETLSKPLLLGLASLHASGFVHADIKPANIFLSSDGQVRLMDFGLAVRIGEAMSTVDSEVMGTALYTAPERWSQAPVGPATDLYSLGVVLYEVMTGLLPWSADGEMLRSLKQRRLTKGPRHYRPELPEAWAHLVSALLHPDPAARPQGALEVSPL